jgi:hypothetical protein
VKVLFFFHLHEVESYLELNGCFMIVDEIFSRGSRGSKGDKGEGQILLGKKEETKGLGSLSTSMLTLMSSIIWNVQGTFSWVDNKPFLIL